MQDLLLTVVAPDEPVDFDQAWRDLRECPPRIRELTAELADMHTRLRDAKFVVERALRDSGRIALGKP